MQTSVRGQLHARGASKLPAVARRQTIAPPRAGMLPIVRDIAQEMMKKDPPQAKVGDTVKLGLQVIEGNGKSRTQYVEGLIIAQHGESINRTMTFRRIFQGVGIELTLPIHSPVVQSMQFIRRGKVRRAKLYYLRKLSGKAAKLKQIHMRKPSATASKQPATNQQQHQGQKKEEQQHQSKQQPKQPANKR